MGTARRVLAAAPDQVALAALALTLPVAVTVTFGWFVPWLVAASVLVVGLLLWRIRLTPPKDGAGGEGVVGAATVALLGSLVWIVVQLRYSGEHIAVDRDPAVYALSGLWLTEHPSVTVPMTEAAAASEGIPGARTVGLGFGRSADPLLPEANHTVPGVVAVAGWFGGTQAVLSANVVVAGAALLALYGAGRRVLGPWWALLPPGVLALAMPMAAFSRSTYSEPLSLLLISGAAAALAAALGGPAGRLPRGPLLLAGLFFGAVGLVRIDGGLVLAGAVLALGVAYALVGTDRSDGFTGLAVLAGPGVALVLLGLLDLALGSGNYLSRLAGQAVGVLAAVLLSVGLCAMVVAVGRPVTRWVEDHRRRLAVGAAASVAVVSLLLASRPWWYRPRLFAGQEGFERDIGRLQLREGLPVDGARSYDELSLTWVAWYHGWPAVLLGVAGLSLLAYLALAGARRPLLAVLLPLGVPALLYLVHPAITPDHVWAMRRLVLGAVPLLLVGVAGLMRVTARRGTPGGLLATVGVGLVAVWPLTTWSGLFEVRDRVGQVDEAAAACAQLTDGRVVLAENTPGVDYLPTVRIMCDAQVVQLTPATQQSLADLRARWGGRPLVLLTFDRSGVPWTQPPEEPVHRAALAMWERSLVGPPSQPALWRRVMWVGEVQPDGRVAPVDPVRPDRT